MAVRRPLFPLALCLAPLVCGNLACVHGEPAGTALSTVETELPDDVGEQWVELAKDDDGEPVAMKTAIVRYVPADAPDKARAANDGPYVDLVGAVHIADQAYYDELNERFKAYDAVLYELVAAEGTVVPKGRGTSNSHPLGALQNGMKSMLELEHQLEQVDYTAKNFVHADMSPDEFMKSMEDRDDGFVKMYLRMVGASLAQQTANQAEGESPEFDFMVALMSEDRARLLKVAMAKQFEGMESLLTGFSGPEGSTLITERNKRALAVLRDELDAGKKKLAIFYGAGHLADMHERMETEFHYVPVSQQWLEAWDLREK